MLLAHLSDLHIDDTDFRNMERLQVALAELARVQPRPRPLLITGDLTQHGRPAQYALLRDLLRNHEPYFVIPGNHDDAVLTHRFFPDASPRAGGSLSVELDNELRLILADSTIPGQDHGELSAELLHEIAVEMRHTDRPTLLAMHHPPVPAQVPAMAEMGLRDCLTFRRWAEEQRQIVAILAGHYHQAQFSALGRHCPVLVAPSVAPTLLPDFCTRSFQVEDGPVACFLHHWKQDHLSTHVLISRHQAVTRPALT